MNDNLEQQLKSALRRQPAPEGFAERTIARAAAKPKPVRAWLSMALAAILLVTFAGTGVYRARQQRADETKRQLMVALEITSQKLARVERLLDRSTN